MELMPLKSYSLLCCIVLYMKIYVFAKKHIGDTRRNVSMKWKEHERQQVESEPAKHLSVYLFQTKIDHSEEST